MSVLRPRGRGSRRSSGRWQRFLSRLRISPTEGLLAAMALVLVIWLCWPDERGPKLDQRAVWQESLRQAEAERARKQAAKKSLFELERARELARAPAAAPTGDQPPRRRLKPSELADRPGPDAAGPAGAPPAVPPAAWRADLPPAAAPAALDQAGLAEDAETAQEALDQVVTAVGTDPAAARPPAAITVLSTESLDAEQPLDAALPGPRAPADFAFASDPSADIRRRPRDDAPSWLNNAVTASLADNRPVIAVVIDDLGLNRPGTAALNTLPGPLTLAFLPYAGKLEAQTQAAHAAGHELIVHLPMEPIGAAWPGPDALTTDLDRQDFVARLQKNLNRFKGFVGVNNHMGSRLTADRGRMDVVMRELRKRDVLFLDSRTSARSVATEVANLNGVPNTVRDVFLDHVIDRQAIRRQTALVERIARQTGSAVAIGHPHGETIEVLESWLPGLKDRGFVLVPISAVVARRACRDGLLIAAATCGRYLQASKSEAQLAAGGG